MNIKAFLAATFVACILSGCSGLNLDFMKSEADAEPHALAYHENSLNCLALGRHYQSQGRFELARETFLHGLATSRDKEMQKRLAAEIEATDRLIMSNR